METDLIVYARYDENNSIIAIDSNIFIDDLTGWKEIDRWVKGQDRYLYAHADNGEYVKEKHGKPLYDDMGRPNFHDDFVEWTDEEKYEFYVKPFVEEQKRHEQEQQLNEMMLKAQQVSFLIELPDEEAIKIPLCYPTWQSFIGKSLKQDERVEHEGKLWKVRQNITQVLEHQPPSIETSSLYEVINETHAGTIDDPIPYDMNLAVFKDKYYLEEDVLYKCIRDSGNPLYATCKSLVGNYFEVVSD